MNERFKLFTCSKLYNHKDTDWLFMKAVRKNVYFHKRHCSEYAGILKNRRFKIRELKTTSDLYKLPAIPTLYLKYHRLKSMKDKEMLIKATSSGTKGKKSHIGFDAKGLAYGFCMVVKTAIFHKLISWKPTNYILLGYQPNINNQTVISKTAFGSTFFSPALKREYAIKYAEDGYHLDISGLKSALVRFSRQPFPVRLVGFPAYMYFFLLELKQSDMTLKLHKDSMILLGGGWKQYYSEKVDKKLLYQLIKEVLGIEEDHCKEFFGAVEHPMVYCECKNHHFHVPAYSRVIIRDVNTLLPVQNGKVGLLNLITPMLDSMPLVSVITDDLAILHDGEDCGCGIDTPYFEIIGRSGVEDIKTCAASATELLSIHSE